MRLIHNLDEMTETARGWLACGPVGFIPTSGHLHSGHLSLVRAAQHECEITVVSIFAAQDTFHPPRESIGVMHSLGRDLQLLETTRVDVVFVPHPAEMYPSTCATYVMASGPLVERLEHTLANDHGRCFATVFTKLHQLIRPDMTYFGQKNAQQVALAYRLLHDLRIDTRLRVLPTVREGDGLALSADNSLLSPDQRQAAPLLYRALLNARAQIEQGERQVDVLEASMAQVITSSPLLRLEYAAICHPSTFEPLRVLPDQGRMLAEAGFVLAVAAFVGDVRLNDNIQFIDGGYWLT